MKKVTLLICLFFYIFRGLGQSLSSVNVLGNRFVADNSTHLYKTQDSKFLVFGASANLGVIYADFVQGATKQLFFHSNNPDLPISELQGAGGVAEDDTTFVVIGQFEYPDENAQLVVVKATESGTVLWANKLASATNDFADKIIKCQNGDYLISLFVDRRADNFGNQIAGSAVLRIDKDGNLLWYANVDQRAEANSQVLSLHELTSGNIVVVQNFSEQLALIKFNADGDSLNSVLSSDSLFPTAAALMPDGQGLFVTTATTALLSIDTSFSVNAFVKYNHTNINEFSSVLSVNDSTLAIGGKYLNEVCILNVNNTSLSVRNLYHHSFFPYAGADLQGMFVLEDTFYSLLSNGFALSRHDADLGHDCFDKVTGNLVSTVPQSHPSFGLGTQYESSHPTFGQLLGIYTNMKQDIQPSANCLNYDLSIRTEYLRYENSCRNILLKYYVFNHGIAPITSFDITTYFSDTTITKSYTLSNPITGKTGVYIDYGEYYIDPGDYRLSYIVSKPNGMTDEYSYNDSFYTDYKTIPNVTIGINAYDSICTNALNVFTTTGPEGTFSLLRNNNIILQGVTHTYSTTAGGGLYQFMYVNAKGCQFYSDSFFVKELALPPTPSLTTSHDTLFTDGVPSLYWYFNNNLLDSFSAFFLYRGTGNYKVVSINQSGCAAQNELLDLVLNTQFNTVPAPFYFANNTLFWQSKSDATVALYSLDGRKLEEFNIYAQTPRVTIQKPVGVYFLVIQSERSWFTTKILVQE
ncbi:MAG: T9SS type A sorting domain-containing protein [Bacteroidia bacterium]|nr:T9SS type A sorting domain-containing protein [Bacteroidia bacterium]